MMMQNNNNNNNNNNIMINNNNIITIINNNNNNPSHANSLTHSGVSRTTWTRAWPCRATNADSRRSCASQALSRR